MLISFSVENFRSFKEEATLSMVAGNGKEMRDSHVFTPELKNGVKSIDLLPSAVIYGPNASGKSNLIEALGVMKWIVCDTNTKDVHANFFPFLYDNKTREAPLVFEVVMLIDGVRYQYGFSIMHNLAYTKEMGKIHSEWLFAFPKGRTQTWFEREYDEKTNQDRYTFGDSLKGQKEVWRAITRPDNLFLSTAVKLNGTQLQPIYDWFVKKLHYINADGINHDYSAAYCHENGGKKITDFLKASDFSIENIYTSMTIDDNLDGSIPKNPSDRLATFLTDNGTKTRRPYYPDIRHKTKEDDYISVIDEDMGDYEIPIEDFMSFHMESDGTQRMFALAAPFLEILETGSILVIDELNQRLHPHLMQYLIEIFNNPKTNPNNAQLIFTTHAVSLLKKDIFRRDQIWFCERRKDQATILFPLSDFKPRKGYEDFEGYYMGGRYGALPIIGDFSNVFQNDAKK